MLRERLRYFKGKRYAHIGFSQFSLYLNSGWFCALIRVTTSTFGFHWPSAYDRLLQHLSLTSNQKYFKEGNFVLNLYIRAINYKIKRSNIIIITLDYNYI